MDLNCLSLGPMEARRLIERSARESHLLRQKVCAVMSRSGQVCGVILRVALARSTCHEGTKALRKRGILLGSHAEINERFSDLRTL